MAFDCKVMALDKQAGHFGPTIVVLSLGASKSQIFKK